MRLAIVLLVVVTVLGVLLATQDANLTNDVRIALPFVDVDWTGPVLWMVGGWFGAGLLLGYLVALPGRVGASLRARKIEKQLATSDEPVKPSAGRKPAASSSATEADEMQKLADEVARRTESVQNQPPPSQTI
ncbi:MAG: LapA family protein [Bacteroidota bacterium]